VCYNHKNDRLYNSCKKGDKKYMKFYDISQEIFSAEIYPGDPVPEKKIIMSLDKEEPDACQLSELFLGSHTGTHIDAPKHFYRNGKTIEQLDLEQCIGRCTVVEYTGEITEKEVDNWLLAGGCERLLIKGEIVITEQAAQKMVDGGVRCVGVEGLTVGSLSAPKEVHCILLRAEVVIIEGLRMKQVQPGTYFLMAQPLKMAGLDGSPVRAVLLEDVVMTCDK
jgi:arylformamidase